MQTKNQKIGILAEQIAQKFLKDQGHLILALNYARQTGEVDIISQKGECIHFIEVKANHQAEGDGFSPELRVDKNKFFHIVQTARIFLHENDLMDSFWQVDIVSIIFELNSKKAKLQYFKKVNFD